MAIFQIYLLYVNRVLADLPVPSGFGDAERNGINNSFVAGDPGCGGNLGAVKTSDSHQAEAQALRLQIKILGGMTGLEIDVVIMADIVKSLGHDLHVAADDQER